MLHKTGPRRTPGDEYGVVRTTPEHLYGRYRQSTALQRATLTILSVAGAFHRNDHFLELLEAGFSHPMQTPLS